MFRIKRYPRGWVVEIQKRRWWGGTYWTHFVGKAGLEHHSTYDYALDSLLRKIKWDCLLDSPPPPMG